MKVNSHDKKWMTVALHLLCWLIILSLPYLLRPRYDGIHNDPESFSFFILNTFTSILWVGVFYLNAYFITPKYIYAKNYLGFAIVLLGIFIVAMVIHLSLFSFLIHHKPISIRGSLGFNLPTFLLTTAVSTTYKFLFDRAKLDKLAQEKQEQNLKTELSFLRSQISPHFVFNVLNNMVALVRMKSDQLEPTIMKLSGLMQYMLYETDEEKVMLETEVEYLQSYIDLQQQRFGSKVKVNVSFQVTDNWLSIEPMMLIPFVENAFKHGVGMIEQPEINIKLKADDKFLLFEVYNKYNDQTEEIKDKTSGIGLPNVKRRLNLLYGNQHELLINRKDGWFSIYLKLNLH